MHKTFFGGHPKKGLHDLWGKKFVSTVAQNFSGKFGKIRAKILRIPENSPAPTLVVLNLFSFITHFSLDQISISQNLTYLFC